jgi:prepilin-type N-terminal cleavage/methylation domain-containing protein
MTAPLSSEQGYSLIEMLWVLILMGTIMTALTAIFVSGTRSEVDLNDRFRAQQDAVVSLDRLRRDVHCASAATASSATAVTLAVPCVSGGTVKWCTAGSGTRYTLHRLASSATCDATSAKLADYLTTGSVFSYELASINNLAKLRVNLPVQQRSMKTPYRLCDILVMRNSYRVGSPGTPVPAC